VMSVDYRLAPEHPFPTAHNDALAASRWIIDNLNALAPNNGEVVIAGDSAGGNLTLATAARLPDEPRLRGCLMMYPAIQHYHAAMRSYTEHAKSGPLTTSIMRWFTDTYLDGLAPADPRVELMFPGRRTTLAGFPRSLLITAEKDPLRDDGRRLANTLQRANVTVQHEHFDREAHGFPCSEGPTPGHERFMAITKTWIEAISER
jgi:acetyl esterase